MACEQMTEMNIWSPGVFKEQVALSSEYATQWVNMYLAAAHLIRSSAEQLRHEVLDKMWYVNKKLLPYIT